MIEPLGYIIAIISGLMFGSFAGATVWRLRARQLVQDKSEGEPVDANELKRLKPLTKATLKDDRSRCLHCRHVLAWYDLIPLVSWMSTNGKCRYCHRTIGRFEPLVELGMATAFILTFHAWLTGPFNDQPWLLVGWLIAIVMLGILFAYDSKWFLLPDRVTIPLIGLSAVLALYQIIISGEPVAMAISTAFSVLILSGLYLFIWLASKGAWVGFGDVKLGLALGLLLADWKLALLALLLANVIGTLVVLPGLISRKLSRGTQVPFGPYLIVGFFIAFLIGHQLIEAYERFSNWLTMTLLML